MLINVVKLAYANNYSVEEIIKITNLSKEKILSIINKHCENINT
jgi:hypothetical protein